MNGNAVVAYSLLATLNNNGSDLVKSVYLPMFKRALSIFSQSAGGGHSIDIQHQFESDFGFRIPEYTVRQFLKLIAKELQGKERNKFELFDGGKSFKCDNYTFIELEETRDFSQRKIRSLESAFSEYSKVRGYEIDASQTISEFLSNNREYLASLFVTKSSKYNQEIIKIAEDKLLYVDFIREIEYSNPSLYEVCRELYLGSIIASLLEAGIDFSSKFSEKQFYYFDTQFILRALDLQDEDETRPALELLALLRKNKNELKVLNTTIEEIQSILHGAAKDFDGNAWLSVTRNSSVQSACNRRHLTKTDLQMIADSVGETIFKKLGIIVEEVSPKIIHEAQIGPEHRKLMDRRYNKASALHDIVAMMHIRHKRGNLARSVQKAKFWFVSPNHDFIKFCFEVSDQSAIKEVVSPDELACLTWLQNPTALSAEASRTGLNALISETISSALPSIHVLNEMPRNIEKYGGLSESDYLNAITRLSQMSILEINKIQEELYEPEKVPSLMAQMANEQRETIKLIEQSKNSAINDLQESKIKFESMIETERSQREAIEKSLRQLIEEERSKIQQQQQENFNRHELSEYKHKRNFWLILTLFVIIFYILLRLTNFWSTLQSTTIFLIKGITGLSGLWSFGSFAINLQKTLKKQ